MKYVGGVAPLLIVLVVALAASSCRRADSQLEPDKSIAQQQAVEGTAPSPATADEAPSVETMTAPGLGERTYIAPLADAYRRIDPESDGWQSEAFHEAASAVLAQLSQRLGQVDTANQQLLRALVTADFQCQALKPKSLTEIFGDGAIRVRRGRDDLAEGAHIQGPDGLVTVAKELSQEFGGGLERITLKLFQVDPQPTHVMTTVYFQAFGKTSEGRLQINATWKIEWTTDANPRLKKLTVESYEDSLYRGGSDAMFVDCTESVMGELYSYRNQFLYPTDYWRARIPRDLGLDVVANHGLAIGDVNGDNLDDIYICQQGGLPNRLLIQRPDGTLRDATLQSGADYLDYCASALLIDLDNDGDRDLVIAAEWRILFLSNNGAGRFVLEFGIGSRAQSYSMSAADYDLDGDLDVYVCGYNPTAYTLRRGAMGEPMPYHDANNGGPNMLLRNDPNWEFNDVTEEVGLNQNNTRFSFAAAWEDYDNDGDSDLYVANDYGRNNLYRNDGGRFVDVAAELDVEDMSAGMSVSWADFNRDGWMDLYVSNMFSAAGNRITYQRQFKNAADESVRRQFQRHARGNTLFENLGNGQFRDVSVQAGVTMGRWAWGSRFVDINGDGWDDLLVANGFITTADTGDL